MTYRLRLPVVVSALLLAFGMRPAAVLAQQAGVLPLPADPARAAQHKAPTARRGNVLLTLPFFEDFAGQREGAPNPDRWEPTGGVLVNERFSQAPPSRGIATFDGLNTKGRSYGTTSSFSFTDTLTSHPIDLSGLRASDRTYLSFFWQAGSIVGAPSAQSSTRPVFLQLEFLDNNENWVVVWRKPSQGLRTDFTQRFIAVNEARFLHANFRFRFRSSGNQFGTRDTWNLDYLVLDRNRDTTNVSYADVVLSRPLSSLLERYTSMPVWQYNAAANPAQELNDSTFTTFNNLDAGAVPPTPFSWTGVVRLLPTGTQNQFLTGGTTLGPGTRQFYIGGPVGNNPVPITSDPKRIEHSIYISLLNSPANPRTAPNDTVRRITELNDYFAYDDGSAEGTTLLRQSEARATSRALRFAVNRPDQLRSVRFYFAGATAAPGTAIPTNVTLTFAVWDASGPNGLPAEQPRVTKSVTLKTDAAQGGMQEVVFDQPVPVSGNFYVGYIQPATNLFIQFGADLNSRQPRNAFYDNETGVWVVFSNRDVVPMLRPVMMGTVTSTRPPKMDASLQVYPNPSHGTVQVAGRYARATLVDALGREVWQQPASEAGQAQLNLRAVTAGVYLLRLTLPDGSLSTHRLVLQP
ncbi:T9SS type A sorting domain-containing protein [Solirubrum puertoriconensis]|nr:T9SS type A sorting domain-containing protein [Solirubrum puertoriconensis]